MSKMSVNCRRATLLATSIILTAWSIGYFFAMLSISKCVFDIYDKIFVCIVASLSGVCVIYFGKMVLIGDSCCKWLTGLIILVAIGSLVVLLFTKHNIVTDYGIGFDNICQTLTSIYLFGNGALILITIIIATMCTYIVAPDQIMEVN